MTDRPPTSLVQRIFLGWDGPALPRAAKRVAEVYAGAEGLDLRQVVVVTPAARAGRRLVELLLDEAEARGVHLIPPETVTIGRFPELLYQATTPPADSTTARHAFSQALKGMNPAVLTTVFPTLPQSMSGWMALAGVVDTLHKEIGAEGLGFFEVGQAFHRGFPYDDSARWEVLASVQDAYLEILKDAGLGDRDRERRRALHGGDLVSPGDVWLVGVVELPRVVRGMLEALPGPIRALIHAPDEIQDRFDALGCVVPSQWETVHIPLDDEMIRVAQRPPDQADAVAGILHGFGQRYAAEEVVVGVPDPELVPYVERGLSMVGVSHRFAGGIRLEDTGPVRLLQPLGEYLNGRPYPAFGALARHPDLHPLLEGMAGKEGEDEEVTGTLTIADRFQSDHLQASVEGPLPGEDKYARRMRGLVAQLENTLGLEGFTGTRRLSEWMPGVLEVLVRVYGRHPLDRGSRGVRLMVEALTRIKGAAARLALLPRTLDGEVEGWEAVALLLAELRGEAIPPDPEEHAVELLGWLELPLDDAPAVILTGVNDRHLPEAMGADPFLPGALRSHLELADDGARYARDAYLLSALTHSREEVHLVAGRLSAAGDPLRPSRLLFAAPDEEVARRVRRYLDDDEGRPFTESEASVGVGPDGAVADTTQPPLPATESRFASPPRNPLPALESLPRIRVTDFSAYLADPYSFALTRILNLGPLDDGAREMDGMSFGNLAHQILERFGVSEEAASPDAEIIRKKLERLLEGAVHEGFGRRPLPTVRVQTEQLRARLRRFAEWQAGWVQEGWRVVCVEQQPEPGVPFEVDGQSVLLRGKIDRIDHNPLTEEWAIFDYKTGDGGKDPEKAHRKGRGQNKEWVDLQLPLYRRLLAGILKEDGTPVVPEEEQGKVKLGYILLPKKLDGVGAAQADWTESELAEAEETARRVVRELRTEEFSYDPTTKSFRDDPFDALLGRKELPQAPDENEGGGE
jgi:ATP-dependent helicase/nuclease subunit B